MHLVETDDFPPVFDTFADYKEASVQYRARLLQIVRLAAALLPEQVCGPGVQPACSDVLGNSGM